MQTLASQFYAFVVTVLMGLTIGILFDFYKFTKGIVRPGRILGYVADILFWVVSTTTVFLLLLIGNWGEIRLYVVIGVILGTLVYTKFLSRLTILFFQGAFRCIKTVVTYILKTLAVLWMVVSYPVILLRNIIVIPIGYLGILYSKTTGYVRRFLRRLVVEPVNRASGAIRGRIKRAWASLFKKT